MPRNFATPITLPGNAVSAMQAVTLQQLNSAIAASVSSSTKSTPEMVAFTPHMGALGTDNLTDAQMDTMKANGANAVNIAAFWDRLQAGSTAMPALSSADVTALNGRINSAAAKGLAVYLSFDVQYAPDWVRALPKLKNQINYTHDGDVFAGVGERIPDYIWSAQGRAAITDFVTKVSAAITNKANVKAMRIGGGPYNEVRMPTSVNDGNASNLNFWFYSEAAKGTGLATGMSANPYPNYTIYSGNASQDTAIENWAFDSMGLYIAWWHDLIVAQGWTVPLYVMHTSTMVRSDWAVNLYARKLEIALLCEPRAVMERYKGKLYARAGYTWLDNRGTGNWDDQVIDSFKAGAKLIADEATARRIPGPFYGENTGGNTDTDMNWMFANPIAKTYFKVLFWAFYDSLTAGTSGTLTNFNSNATAAITATARMNTGLSKLAATGDWNDMLNKPTLSGSGDMTKAVYDVNNDGVIDNAAALGGVAAANYATLTGTQAFTNKNLTGAGNTFPTFNQSTTGSAASLTTARNIQTNLASAVAAGFNGTGNITPGVTGTLPVANGGTGVTTSTGSGANVLGTSPTLVTPTLGVAAATTLNKVTITAPATSATLTLAQGSTLALAGAFATTFTATAATSLTLPTSGTLAVISGALGTPTSVVLTNATGLPVAGLNASGTRDATSFLRGDGTWAIPAGGGGSPGGSDMQLQFNSGGAFAGSNIYYQASNGRISVGSASNFDQSFTVTGTGFSVRTADATKGFRARFGGATDFEATGSLFLSVWSGPNYSGTQYNQIIFNGDGGVMAFGRGFYPDSNNVYDIGQSGNYWKTAFIRKLYLNGGNFLDGSVNDIITVNGTLALNQGMTANDPVRFDTNVAIGVALSNMTGSRVLAMASGSVPTTNIAGAGQLYVENGALMYRGSAGTISLVGAA